jgi:hypothetical protein
MKDLIAFTAIIGQMDHGQKPRIKLYWIKKELYHGPFYSSVLPYDHFLKTLANMSHPNVECYWNYHFKFHLTAKWGFKSL